MNHYEMVVIGAGISGLSMAHYAVQEGLKTLVLEGSHQIGGSLHSHHFNDAASGFWVELGAHSCFNSYGNLLRIMEQLNLLDLPVKRATSVFRMWADGHLKTLYSQLNIPELLLSLPRAVTVQRAGRTVREYYGAIVGEKNYRNVLSHAFAAVLCQPADGVPAEMLFRKRPRRRDVARSFTLPEGLQTIAQRIAAQAGLAVRVNQPVRLLSWRGGQFHLRLNDSTDYTADLIAVATPADTASRLLRTSFPEVAAILESVRMAAVTSVGVAVRKTHLALPALAGIIARNADFFSVVSRDTVDHPEYRGFTFHFKPDAVDEATRMARIAQVLEISTGTLAGTCTKHTRLPAPEPGHDERIAQVDGLLAGASLALTGNYFHGVSIEDCVSRSRTEFERLMQQ